MKTVEIQVSKPVKQRVTIWDGAETSVNDNFP